MIRISFGYCPPSQNVTSRRHWSSNKRDVDLCAKLIWASTPVGATRAIGKRSLHVLSYRVRLVTDRGNLIGGCKYLVDAVVRRGLLKDDSDRWATITYDQRLLSALPDDLLARYGRNSVTVLTITE